jgi:hypothetical protein
MIATMTASILLISKFLALVSLASFCASLWKTGKRMNDKPKRNYPERITNLVSIFDILEANHEREAQLSTDARFVLL